MADEATNAAAKELLKLISTFQLRLKEKNPLKVKQKLRFVCGLKQVTYLFSFFEKLLSFSQPWCSYTIELPSSIIYYASVLTR